MEAERGLAPCRQLPDPSQPRGQGPAAGFLPKHLTEPNDSNYWIFRQYACNNCRGALTGRTGEDDHARLGVEPLQPGVCLGRSGGRRETRPSRMCYSLCSVRANAVDSVCVLTDARAW